MNLGTNVKHLRKQNKMTQVQLATLLNIKQSNISDWENNVTRPEYENLLRIAVIFDTSVDYLLGLKDEYGNETELYKSLVEQVGKTSK